VLVMGEYGVAHVYDNNSNEKYTHLDYILFTVTITVEIITKR